MKDKVFLIGTLVTIVAGAIYAAISIYNNIEFSFAIFGFALLFVGIVLMATGYITPTVAQSKEGMAIGLLLIVASIVAIVGVIIGQMGLLISIIGASLAFLAFLMWPCLCCQGRSKYRDKIIGIANAHDSITMQALSQKTGQSTDVVSDVIYDAIGKGQLKGRMEEDTFVRDRPSPTAPSSPSSVTKEREVVKVLVVCPFCGAKNEQGTPKCHNCQASL